MKSKLIANGNEKTFAVIFYTGDEVMSMLTEFAMEKNLQASRFTAIGAFSSVTLAWYNLRTKEYENFEVQEQVEALSFIGDITLDNGKPKVHAHAVIGKRDGNTRGGHVVKAIVSPTLEVMLTESPSPLLRAYDNDIGLPLIDPDK